MRKFWSLAVFASRTVFAILIYAFAQKALGKDYLVYILSKSAGKIMLIRHGLRMRPVEREITANMMEMGPVK